MAANTMEREIKLDVGRDFSLPDPAGVVDDVRQSLVTTRRRLVIKAPSGERLAVIDDDTVTVIHGAEPAGQSREVEVELEADDEAVLDAVVARLAAAGARPARAKPKLARALGAEEKGPPRPAARPRGRRESLAQVITAAIADGVDRPLDHDLGVTSEMPTSSPSDFGPKQAGSRPARASSCRLGALSPSARSCA